MTLDTKCTQFEENKGDFRVEKKQPDAAVSGGVPSMHAWGHGKRSKIKAAYVDEEVESLLKVETKVDL